MALALFGVKIHTNSTSLDDPGLTTAWESEVHLVDQWVKTPVSGFRAISTNMHQASTSILAGVLLCLRSQKINRQEASGSNWWTVKFRVSGTTLCILNVNRGCTIALPLQASRSSGYKPRSHAEQRISRLFQQHLSINLNLNHPFFTFFGSPTLW